MKSSLIRQNPFPSKMRIYTITRKLQGNSLGLLICILEENAMNETFICSCCGEEYPSTERVTFSGQELCEGCYASETCVCDRCGDRIWAEDSVGDENHTLCHDCEDRYYERCADCGCLVALENLHYLPGDDEDDGYCESCYNRRIRDDGIHNYSAIMAFPKPASRQAAA